MLTLSWRGREKQWKFHAWWLYRSWSSFTSLTSALKICFATEFAGSLNLLSISCDMCTSNKTRYILTPYLVVVWATSAIYDKKTGPMEADDNIIGASIDQVNDYVLAIIIIAVLTFVIRAALVVMRTLKSPIWINFCWVIPNLSKCIINNK